MWFRGNCSGRNWIHVDIFLQRIQARFLRVKVLSYEGKSSELRRSEIVWRRARYYEGRKWTEVMIDLIFLPFISSLVFAQIHESFRSYSDRDHFLMDGFVYPKYYLTRKHNQVIKKSGENDCIGSRASLDTTTIIPHSFTARNSLCMESTSHWKWTWMRFNATFSTETLFSERYTEYSHIFTLSFRIQTIIFTITNQLVHLLGLKAIDYWAEAEKTTIFTRFLIRMTQQ